MYMKLIDDQAYFGVSFDLKSFPELIQAYRNKNDNTKKTPDIEEQGRNLIAKPIDDFSTVEKFIMSVCEWGGPSGARVRGKVLKNNTDERIVSVFEKVRQIFIQQNPDVAKALSEMISLNGLGESFASKHLRFMLPEECPVYDSVLCRLLPYPSHLSHSRDQYPGGYANFAKDCKIVGEELQSMGINNPVRNSGTWFVADIEAIIWNMNQSNDE